MSISLSTTGRSGLVYLVGAGMLWGTGGLLGTLLGRATGLSPIAVATCRLAVGGLLLVALLAATRRSWPRNLVAWRRIGAVAVLAATFQACYFGAVAASSVSVATLITIGASPVVVALLEQFTGRRAVDRRRAATIGLALSGLALLVGVPSDDVGSTGLLAGAALAVAAAAAFATVTVISSQPVEGLDPMTTTGLGFTGGAALLTPLAVTTGITFTPTPGSLALLAALGLVPTAIAYTLYFRGLPDAGPGTAAILALLEPLTGALLAAIVLGERLTPLGLLGAALLTVALVLTSNQSRTGEVA
ncbi:EamA family transporter [Nocardia colli]|uniref:EamA family transporter n=1 Tax=Nocardia colli TaxID=2545717 RepID=A0A5N0DKL2_9NOCA|nr:EamA family transporter [Nocardia colli]KAA8877226.1 EamA family transporter [Nocardia colli]